MAGRPTREDVFSALFTRVSAAKVGGNPAFTTKSRLLKHWSDLAPEAFNALFMAKGNESVERTRGLPPKVTLHAMLYVYVRTNEVSDDAAQSPSQILDPILDALDQALSPDGTDPMKGNNVCTLGGLVSHAWIKGEVVTSEGTLGDIEVALVPVEVLVPVLANQGG